MLTREGCAARRARLWASLSAPVDALVVADPANLIYLANYDPSWFVFRSCDATAVLVLTPDRATLVADKMVQTYLNEAHVDDVIAPVWYDGKHSAPHRQALVAHT
ncbi:MAG: aminopeptidase P family N-terminal domain-containing protein, partial [Isosphaeraceae bacterium]